MTANYTIALHHRLPQRTVADVSVVIPTYNRYSFLRKAVASCFEGNQKIDIEVIVVDDGSTDGTGTWLQNLEDSRVRPVFRKHRGAQEARNAGLHVAEGETLKFLDDDDYLYAGALVEQYEYLQDAGADVCYGTIDIVDEEGRRRGEKLHRDVDDLLGGIATGVVTTYPHVFLYRTEVARLEEWRPEVPFHQDTAYALDIATHNPSVAWCSRKIGAHRLHEGIRITTTAKAESSVQNIKYKFDLLYQAFQKRGRHAQISNSLKGAVARGLWTEAHKLAPSNFECFQDCWEQVQDVDPCYLPKRSSRIVGWLDRLWGPTITERLINPLRVLKLHLGGDAV